MDVYRLDTVSTWFLILTLILPQLYTGCISSCQSNQADVVVKGDLCPYSGGVYCFNIVLHIFAQRTGFPTSGGPYSCVL